MRNEDGSVSVRGLSLSAKLNGILAAITLLMILVAVVGVDGLSHVQSLFADYRLVARSSNAFSEIQTHMLSAQLSVRDYRLSDQQREIEQTTAHLTTIREKVDGAMTLGIEPATRSELQAIKRASEEYGVAFGRVVDLQFQRHRLVQDTMDVIGPTIVLRLRQLQQETVAAGNTAGFKLASETLEGLLRGRLEAHKFLLNNEEIYFDRSVEELEATILGAEQILASGLVPPAGEGEQNLAALLQDYQSTFEQVAGIIRTRNNLFSTALVNTGATISEKLTQLQRSSIERQDEIGPRFTGDIAATSDSTMIAAGLAALFALGGIGLVVFQVIRPIRKITSAMNILSKGELELDLEETDRRDEIGIMISSVRVFRDNALERQHLLEAQKKADEERRAERRRRDEEERQREQDERQKEQERERQLEAEKRAAMEQLAADFEANVMQLVADVTRQSEVTENAAQSMASLIEETSNQTDAVSAASQDATANLQTVAGATEELSSSVQEINIQTNESSQKAKSAVTKTAAASKDIETLAAMSDRISAVVNLISDIAEQTNLLALNATIEAARAGDAGRGFAVVASEVKNLATQTGKATMEISDQINSMQDATEKAVAAISIIHTTIDDIGNAAVSIASAVEQQDASTREIARSVTDVSGHAQTVSTNIKGVRDATSDTSTAAHQVLSASQELNALSDTLRQQVSRFLAGVRAH